MSAAGLEPAVEAHPLVRAAQALAPALVAAAAETERTGVTREHLAPLAAAGLHGVEAPATLGGAGAPPAVVRRVAEVLAGADPQVWFTWFQHHPTVKALARGPAALAQEWVPRLARGEAYAGVAYSHLRAAEPSVRAVRVDGGWRLSGRQPWCTGWGLVDVVLLGALTHDDDVLFAVVPARGGDGMTAGPEMAMAAMGATATVALGLDDYVVPDHLVVRHGPFAAWTAEDRTKNANVQPSTFGVALAALDLLARRDPDAAAVLRLPLLEVRRRCYRLADDLPAEEGVGERLAARGEAMARCMEAVTAAVVATGGGALAPGHRGQQLLRAGAFQLVHSVDQPVRDAALAALRP